MATERAKLGIGETTEFRHIGIIGDIPWGTHFCHLYETKQDLLDVLIPYFKTGLENNEFCLWIVSDPLGEEEARDALRGAIPEADRYLATGHIEIVPHTSLLSSRQQTYSTGRIEIIPSTEWYLKGGAFVPERVINGWNGKLTEALAKGYAGMRVSANESWLTQENWKDFSQYESTLDETLGNRRMIVVCSYPISGASVVQILDVAHTHRFAIAKRDGHWETLEAPGFSRPKPPVFFSSPAPHVLVRAADGRFIEVNDAFLQLFGYQRGEIIGHPALELGLWVNPKEREALIEMLRQGRAVCDYETRARSKSGEVLDVIVFMVPIELAGEQCVLATVFDNTERKRAEEAIRKSERVLREAESLGHTGSWEQDLVTGEIFNSESNLRLFFGDDQSKGARFEDYAQAVHPDDREFVLRRRAQLVGEGGPGDIEFRVVWPDGSLHTLFGRATVVRDESGNAVRVYGTNVDITDRKRAEEEMKRQAVRAETLTRIAARLNKQLDLDAVVHAVCQEVVDTFKASQATMSLYDAKRDLLDYAGGVNIPPEYAAKIEPISRTQFDEFVRTMGPIMVVPDIQALPNVPNAEFSAQMDVRTVVTADMRRDQELIGVLVLGVNGHVREFTEDELTLLKAISDQAAQAIANAQLFKAANEQREQLRALSAKLVEAQETERRTIARELHDEIGQVLTAVNADLQALQLSPDSAARVERLGASLNLVAEAIKQVRDLSLDLRPAVLDEFGLGAALDWYLDRQAQRFGFQSELVIEPTELRLPPELETTLFRVAQIALTNVERHAHAKRVHVELDRQDGHVELVIRDDGIGFDVPAALERAARGGTLGLLSLQERVQLTGGTVDIHSTPGHGTEIRATFPLE